MMEMGKESTYQPSNYFTGTRTPNLLASETVNIKDPDFYESIKQRTNEKSEHVQSNKSQNKALRPLLVTSLGASDMMNFQTEIESSGLDFTKRSDAMSKDEYETNIVNKFDLNEIDMKNLLESNMKKARQGGREGDNEAFKEYESMGQRMARLSKISEENETFSNTFMTIEGAESHKRGFNLGAYQSVESIGYKNSRALFKSIKQSKVLKEESFKKSKTNFIEQNVQSIGRMEEKKKTKKNEEERRKRQERMRVEMLFSKEVDRKQQSLKMKYLQYQKSVEDFVLRVVEFYHRKGKI
jgi:hypothetical protein